MFGIVWEVPAGSRADADTVGCLQGSGSCDRENRMDHRFVRVGRGLRRHLIQPPTEAESPGGDLKQHL